MKQREQYLKTLSEEIFYKAKGKTEEIRGEMLIRLIEEIIDEKLSHYELEFRDLS